MAESFSRSFSDLDDLDEAAKAKERLSDARVIQVSVYRGQLFIPNPDAAETVLLTPTATNIVFSQKPRVFSQDSNEAVIVKRRNNEYASACARYEDSTTTCEAGVQTVPPFLKSKLTTTALVTHTDCAVEAAFTDIYDTIVQGVDEDLNNLQQSTLNLGDERADDFTAESARRTERRTGNMQEDDKLSDAGTVYTNDDTVSDAGTAYTAATQETATNSMHSSIQTDRGMDDRLRQKKIAQIADKVFNDAGFKRAIHLAELLCLQNPLFPWVSLYRAADVVYNPTINYQNRLRAEFSVEGIDQDNSNELSEGSEASASADSSQGWEKKQLKRDDSIDDEEDRDEKKPNAVSPESRLRTEHLWTYRADVLRGMSAVCCEFCPADERLLIVGYAGSGLDENYGAIVLWIPENPFYPNRILYTRSEPTAVSWYPLGKSIIAVGFTDGAVSLFDLREEVVQLDSAGFVMPLLTSTSANGKHTSRVWDVIWASTTGGGGAGMSLNREVDGDDGEKGSGLPDYDILLSAAADGRIVERSLKRSFEHRDILTLTSVGHHPVATKVDQKSKADTRMTIVRKISSALSSCFLSDGTNYLVSGDDGVIRKASRAYTEQTLMNYSGHLSSIYKVQANPTAPTIFLSASADRSIKIWHVDSPTALLTLKSTAGDHVYTAVWCPFKSTCLISGTRAGSVEIWDIADTSVAPVLVLDPIVALDTQQRSNLEEESTELDSDNSAVGDADPNAARTISVRAISCNKHVPVFAVCYENGDVYIHRIHGIEDNLILSRVQPTAFQETESDRILTILDDHQENAD
ncbi:Putative WD-repeat family protein [Giardia duodenalis]|uniref:Dynein axonemal intermediate chain 4 n=1 Tax=Giardia intestinalis TaxID=5741 RepID=V6TJ02_GIAIN|nr:Putative WD-repeat family protein [Giardia intestinalis]